MHKKNTNASYTVSFLIPHSEQNFTWPVG